jgi:hypothetical protein
MHWLHTEPPNLIFIRADRALDAKDTQTLALHFHAFVLEYGRLKVLLNFSEVMKDLSTTLWRELEFDGMHRGDLERLAVVANPAWESSFTKLAARLNDAETQYFPPEQLADAKAWLRSGKGG